MGFNGGQDVFLHCPVIGEETDLSNSALECGTVILTFLCLEHHEISFYEIDPSAL